MAVVVETGAGISTANSYISLADANTYHTLYGHLDWAGDDATKEQALILATRSVDLLYGPKFLSVKEIDGLGALLFPRMNFYDNNQVLVTDTSVPKCIRDAVCEIALMQLNGIDIFPLPNTDSNVKANTVKIGDIEISNQYGGKRGEQESFDSFRMIDLILYPVLKQRPRYVNLTL